MLLWLSKNKNILMINNWNITINTVYPDSHSVLSFFVYGFHRVSVSSVKCIHECAANIHVYNIIILTINVQNVVKVVETI